MIWLSPGGKKRKLGLPSGFAFLGRSRLAAESEQRSARIQKALTKPSKATIEAIDELVSELPIQQRVVFRIGKW
jgi:hypothetical protein